MGAADDEARRLSSTACWAARAIEALDPTSPRVRSKTVPVRSTRGRLLQRLETACWAASRHVVDRLLQRQNANSTERSRKPANVGRVAGSDDRGFELKGGSNNKSVDGVSRSEF